jgi:dolichol-phosphate mannosyltransferase
VIVAVVPALDEAERIAAVVRGLPGLVDRTLVIDDGSRDRTGDIARSADARVEVIRHPERRGVGAAIARGMMRAIELGAEVAVVLAGDGQMDPADLPALTDPILRDDADLVKGNRLAWPSGALAFPLPRLLGVIALAAATRLSTGLSLDDAQCGYVAVGRRALHAIRWNELWPSFGYPNDLLARAAQLGLRIDEVPVRPIYAGENSKLRVRHLPGIAFVLARAMVTRATR